jgi:hypothetical protein
MIEFAIYFAAAIFLGVTIAGHIVVFRTLFAQADHVCGKRIEKPLRNFLAGYGA